MLPRTICLTFALFLSATAFSQLCEAYFPTDKGATLEYRHSDQINQTEVILKFSLQSKTVEGGATVLNALEVVYDDGKPVMEIDHAYRCEEGIFYIDGKSVFSGPQLQQSGSFLEMTAEGDDLTIPTHPVVGQQLDDCNMKLVAKLPNVPIDFVLIGNIYNRKVEAFEAVTTPAGTFECVKITEDVDSKMAFVNTTGKNKSWYAKNIGLVRQEVFDEKGKLLVRQELVKID